MRNVAFTPVSFKEYNEWFETNRQMTDRIKTLIREIDREPFKGIGKPEPLKGNWSGYWSRRIDQEHRLVYKVTESQIIIVKCKGHY
ncbi:MAG TPA: Txe/YoeB family addiction module toxin [Chitinophagaceae bacterium]|nr:Txe/YoeB family addiction module toxin [Chitinophagaceae bacterium]